MNHYNTVVKFYALVCRWAGPVVLSVVLLLMRIIWGWQFFVAGKGKLSDIDKPIAFFTQLGIPMPTLNAWMVSIVECVGGLLILTGILSRPVALALTINMTVAYLTADREAVHKLFSEGEVNPFFSAAPFWFLITSMLVLGCGPGLFSVDAVVKKLWCGKCPVARHEFMGTPLTGLPA